MTASLTAPTFGPGDVAVSGDPAERLALSGDLAGAMNLAMDRLARLEADLGPDVAAFALPLRQSLADLCGHVDRTVRLLADAAVNESATPACVDGDRFSRLLEIAGPDTANELVHRLHLDLSHARDRLDEAMTANDWPEIRAQTHVLVSLAGTVGADELHRLAEALNAAAHLKDTGTARTIRADLFARLAGLLDFVARQRGGA